MRSNLPAMDSPAFILPMAAGSMPSTASKRNSSQTTKLVQQAYRARSRLYMAKGDRDGDDKKKQQRKPGDANKKRDDDQDDTKSSSNSTSSSVPKDSSLPSLSLLDIDFSVFDEDVKKDITVDEKDTADLPPQGEFLIKVTDDSWAEMIQKAVTEELPSLEWPSIGRVARLVVLVLITVIIATCIVSVSDTTFTYLAKVLFDINYT